MRTNKAWHLKHPLHRSWCEMRRRCSNPTAVSYGRYGGRGIRVCDRWDGSFDAFVEDMGPRPPGTSLDRIDNDGPYSPENCRWATPPQQNRNRRNNIWVELDGEKLCLKDACLKLGVNYHNTRRRLLKGESFLWEYPLAACAAP